MPDTYFIRDRGRTQGPFNVGTLQKLVRRGTISRVTQISSDRASWSAAGDFEELFPAVVPGPTTAVAAPMDVEHAPAVATQVEPPPEWTATRKYFYAQGGVTVGPVPEGVLKALAQNGTLRPDDVVWQEGDQTAVHASQVTVLASAFSAPSSAQDATFMSKPRAAAPSTPHEAAILHRRVAALRFASAALGITVGATILLLLNLPLFRLHSRVYWWWSALNESDSGSAVAIGFYLLLAGIALCILAPLTNGISRGVSYLVVGGAFVLVLIPACASQSASAGTAVGALGYAIPLLACSIIGIARFRPLCPAAPGGRIMQGVVGGVSTAVGVILTIMLLANADPPAGYVTGAFVCILLSCICAVAGGITSIIMTRQQFSKELNLASILCAAGSGAFWCLTWLIFAVGLANEIHVRSAVFWMGDTAGAAMFFLIARFGVMFAGLASLLLVGWTELLASVYLPEHVNAGRSRA